jgi:hypothetical protein
MMMKRRMNTKTKRKKKKMTRILKRRRGRKMTRLHREDRFYTCLFT